MAKIGMTSRHLTSRPAAGTAIDDKLKVIHVIEVKENDEAASENLLRDFESVIKIKMAETRNFPKKQIAKGVTDEWFTRGKDEQRVEYDKADKNLFLRGLEEARKKYVTFRSHKSRLPEPRKIEFKHWTAEEIAKDLQKCIEDKKNEKDRIKYAAGLQTTVKKPRKKQTDTSLEKSVIPPEISPAIAKEKIPRKTKGSRGIFSVSERNGHIRIARVPPGTSAPTTRASLRQNSSRKRKRTSPRKKLQILHRKIMERRIESHAVGNEGMHQLIEPIPDPRPSEMLKERIDDAAGGSETCDVRKEKPCSPTSSRGTKRPRKRNEKLVSWLMTPTAGPVPDLGESPDAVSTDSPNEVSQKFPKLSSKAAKINARKLQSARKLLEPGSTSDENGRIPERSSPLGLGKNTPSPGPRAREHASPSSVGHPATRFRNEPTPTQNETPPTQIDSEAIASTLLQHIGRSPSVQSTFIDSEAGASPPAAPT